jgi:hypothetical protein
MIDDNLCKLLVNWETITDDEVDIVKKSLSDIVKFNIGKMTVIRQSGLVWIAYFIDDKGEELPVKIAFKNNNCYKIYNELLDELLHKDRWLMF